MTLNPPESEMNVSLMLFYSLNKTLRTIQKSLETAIRSYGLNATEFSVVRLLYSMGNQPIQKIGDKISIASSSTTYVIDKLEKKVLLERIPCPNDRRIVWASLTPKGRQLMDAIFPNYTAAVHKVLDGLNFDEKKEFITTLKKLDRYAENFK
ncbi:MarR family winged helix-turn-helix transcriptional regulator [Sporolactobacillus spathodeae]|uniref:MarR family 2-MHQ and catechol resistance regulon transcriptional repressor n=1 Tax=Sporolactobacillus spathodeae TaxID=1465502 RepID=A0ABS2Q4Z3_9BACL|nr:MarR family transcriptional regulator [Sporolactobacillus spathodeae]MBM7656852.1 MarR family 2-MHQ and catechol resistance regulon transcriptional repressor [Sporolactobacillus spathodeae]